MLEVSGLTVRYGPIEAVRGIDLRVEQGEIVALIGPNGAGKSTTLRAIMGLTQAAAGEIRFEGKQIRGRSPEEIVRAGITMTPEGRRIFRQLTVGENLRLGAATRKDKAEAARDQTRLLELFPVLASRINGRAGALSGGEAQQLAIARSLMSKPKLLLLDEPSLGLAPIITEQIFQLAATIREQGTTLLLVEQNVARSLKLADRAYVMATGSIVINGRADELLRDPTVVSAYLGGPGGSKAAAARLEAEAALEAEAHEAHEAEGNHAHEAETQTP